MSQVISMRAWELFLARQEKELGEETVNKWLRPLRVSRFDAGNLYLEAENKFQISWFEEQMRARITASLVNQNRRPIKVHLSLASEPSNSKSHAFSSKKKRFHSGSGGGIPFIISFDSIDPDHTFDSFVFSKSNEMTTKLLKQISDANTQEEWANFNPIYVYGPDGSGKTHLLMAFAMAMSKLGKSVIYVKAQTFADHVVTAIQAGTMEQLRQRYRLVDVLIVDDVDLLAKKAATQEEFFHTFNTLHGAGKQILLAANCVPHQLQAIEPRLISRFEWGIVLTLSLLEGEEMKLLLKSATEKLKFPLNHEVSEFLLETFKNPKSLMQALASLMLRFQMQREGALFTSTQISLLAVQHHLKDLIFAAKQAVITPSRILQNVSEFFGIRQEDILSKTKSRDCALPRQIAIYFCRMQLKLPFTKIADIFARDHSTVMSSVKVIQEALDANEEEVTLPFHAIKQMLKRPQPTP